MLCVLSLLSASLSPRCCPHCLLLSVDYDTHVVLDTNNAAQVIINYNRATVLLDIATLV